MCFIVRGREPKRRLATEDIRVKKVFRIIKPSNKLASPVMYKIWERGKIYKSSLDQPHLVELDKNIWRINRGFYSVKKRFYFRKRKGLLYIYLNFLDWLLDLIFESEVGANMVDGGDISITVENCIIPKGSYYYKDWWTGQIVSDQLMICPKD